VHRTRGGLNLPQVARVEPGRRHRQDRVLQSDRVRLGLVKVAPPLPTGDEIRHPQNGADSENQTPAEKFAVHVFNGMRHPAQCREDVKACLNRPQPRFG
jgi:hypothetical protein